MIELFCSDQRSLVIRCLMHMQHRRYSVPPGRRGKRRRRMLGETTVQPKAREENYKKKATGNCKKKEHGGKRWLHRNGWCERYVPRSPGGHRLGRRGGGGWEMEMVDGSRIAKIRRGKSEREGRGVRWRPISCFFFRLGGGGSAGWAGGGCRRTRPKIQGGGRGRVQPLSYGDFFECLHSFGGCRLWSLHRRGEKDPKAKATDIFEFVPLWESGGGE